jgi:hypothetical protein
VHARFGLRAGRNSGIWLRNKTYRSQSGIQTENTRVARTRGTQGRCPALSLGADVETANQSGWKDAQGDGIDRRFQSVGDARRTRKRERQQSARGGTGLRRVCGQTGAVNRPFPFQSALHPTVGGWEIAEDVWKSLPPPKLRRLDQGVTLTAFSRFSTEKTVDLNSLGDYLGASPIIVGFLPS